MRRNGNILFSEDILAPDREFALPFKKNKKGEYIVIAPKRTGESGISKTLKRKRPNGYLYFIKANGFDLYKLGVSANPRRRLNDIDSYLPFDLEILSVHYFENVYDVESEFSQYMKEYNIRREWYSMPIEKAKEIMIRIHNLNIVRDGSTKR